MKQMFHKGEANPILWPLLVSDPPEQGIQVPRAENRYILVRARREASSDSKTQTETKTQSETKKTHRGAGGRRGGRVAS